MHLNKDYVVGLREKIRERLRDVLVTVSWSVGLASVILRGLYQSPILTGVDLAVLFGLSIFAGLILVDAEKIVLGYVGSFALALFIVFIFLSLPALLGKVEAWYTSLVYEQSIRLIMSNLFLPLPTVVLCLLGAFIGGIVAEALKLR